MKGTAMVGTFFRSVIGRLIFILFTILCLPLFILFLLMPRSWLLKSHFFFRCEHIFHTFVLKLSCLPMTYKGLDHLPEEPAIFVINHQSSFDIPIIGNLMRAHPHVWLALAELRQSLLLRYVLPKVSILVDLTSPAKGVRTLREVIALLDHTPVHVIIFPEGGRFTDGTIHPFYNGFALIARRTGRPVIPVHIEGVNKVYPPGSFIVHSYPVTITIGLPMIIADDETENDFKDRVRHWFVTHSKGHHT